ncbi:hypothetical protein BKA56DRAFT_557041 [Ilyonectria sp. MPI-CAGE-AT-0026]|nr:hypothetical protein BKA56DRAFT_557041 [Ilyonectria sp. MPI-CAGE-AT-0026]
MDPSLNHSSESSHKDPEKHPRRHRRGHTKSRAGCQNCKRRKVKCDEVKPVCGNCIRFSMVCDFSPGSEQHIPAKSPPPETPATKRKPGRPRKNWTEAALEPPENNPFDSSVGSSSESFSAPSPLVTSGPVTSLPPPITSIMDDLDLMHCWTIRTAATLGRGEVWRTHIPPLSFHHPYLCHTMLAMAARHSSLLKPLESERYIALAEHHYELAVREATAQLAHLTWENAQPMYGTMVLVSLYYFARKPSPGDLLVFSENRTVSWMPLLQGVRFIVQTLGHAAIFRGVFAIEPEDPSEGTGNESVLPAAAYQTWQQPLMELIQMMAQSTESYSACCVRATSDLIDCYKATYGSLHDPISYSDGRFEHIMGWLYRLEDEFITQLEAKEPLPLILLAYFAVLLKSLASFWFMEGWAQHLLGEVNGILDSQYSRWLVWPASRILDLNVDPGMSMDPP